MRFFAVEEFATVIGALGFLFSVHIFSAIPKGFEAGCMIVFALS
jgi:hypothetical protein